MNLPRLFRTVRHLKARQIVSRVLNRFRFFRIGRPDVQLRSVGGAWQAPIEKRQTMFGDSGFRVLNQCLELRSRRSWNENGRDKLLLYNLHYHDDLTAAGAKKRLDLHERLIARWIAENPILIGNGWEPYPLSLRIVNWIKWHLAHGHLDDVAMRALWVQARILEQSIEYHLDANHLLANVKAMYFAGAFYSGARAERWFSKGVRGLGKEIDKQVLCDGGHFERSPMYHAIILEDLLDVANLSQNIGVSPPAGLDDAIVRMLGWQETMLHPDGSVSRFNDAVDGIAPSAAALRGYAERLGYPATVAGPHSSSRLDGCGYVRLQNRCMMVLADAGEIGPAYQPGHAHCDTLSFELSIDGRPTIVNRGISTYNVGPLRHEERGTRSHNTVAIDGHEQSEIWAAFRVGRRAHPVDVELSGGRLTAAHDGWGHLGIRHSRDFELDEDCLRISDAVAGPLNAPAVASLHFHPDVSVDVQENVVRFSGGEVHFDGANDVVAEQYSYCRGFGDTVSAVVLRIPFEDQLETRISHAHTVHH